MPNPFTPAAKSKFGPPSENFIKAFRDGCAGCRRECCCGREYFSDEGSPDWEEGELEKLRKLAVEQPDKYRELEYYPSTLTIAGHEWVIDCECNYPAQYERFLIYHAARIARYLNLEAKDMMEKAQAIAVAKILEGEPPLPQNYYPILH